MTLSPPREPLRVVQAGEFWTVLGADTPDGPRVVAQGSRELCELVVTGRPIFAEQGEPIR